VLVRSAEPAAPGPHSVAVSVPWPAGYPERVAAALDHALAEVPAYREWRTLDPGPDHGVFERLARLPALTKAGLRDHGPDGFLPSSRAIHEGIAQGEIELVHTSGTTSERVTNAWHQPWWDASERASWRLNAHAAAADLGAHREAILTSPRSTGVACEDGYLPMEERIRGRFLYLTERSDTEAWTPAHMDRMLRELDEFAPTALEANPSFLARLARHVLATGTRPRQPDLIVLTFENPSPIQLALIRRAFTAPIASSYGATEAGYVFMECERGRMHQVTDCCHVDFLPFARRFGGPRLGRLLVSTLDNPWRALVRFDIGDVARLADPLPGAPAPGVPAPGVPAPVVCCPCGRTGGLVLEGIEGRASGITLDADGGPVVPAAVDRELARVPGLVDHHLRQDGPGTVRIAYVLDAVAGSTRGADRAVRAALARLYGRSCAIEAREVSALPPEPSGKYLRTAPTFAVDVDAFLDEAYRPPSAARAD
jgi:phenylacetate-coenzyme A ligase PaaK-like adenylate-forming protein